MTSIRCNAQLLVYVLALTASAVGTSVMEQHTFVYLPHGHSAQKISGTILVLVQWEEGRDKHIRSCSGHSEQSAIFILSVLGMKPFSDTAAVLKFLLKQYLLIISQLS